MSLCGVSQLFSTDHNECPRECPYWAPSSVWKYVGVCSEARNCNAYNPILNYADGVNNVCLPCNVFGCVSCRYSDIRDSMLPVTDSAKKLPDYCIACAKGYKRASDGRMCYLIESKVWSRLLMYLCALALASIAVLSIRLLLDRSKLGENLNTLAAALKRRRAKMLRRPDESGGAPYDLHIDVTNKNIAGVGLMLYFRSLVFLALVMCLLFFVSLAHVHIPCSRMIRIFKEPFRIYYFMRSIDVPRGFLHHFFAKNVNRLVDDIFNFRSVDDAIHWNVVQYSNEVSGVMHVLYLSVMIMTMVFLVSQKRVISRSSSRTSKLKQLTLVFKNMPPSMTSEEEVSEMIYESTNIRPSSVTICYDLKQHKRALRNFFEGVENMRDREDAYVNFELVEEMNRSLVGLQSSGECFVTFENAEQRRLILHNFKGNRFEVCACDVEPENVLWENIGYEERINRKVLGISILSICFLVCYSIVFFIPYAFYSITSPMSHVLEMLVVSVFIECGNIIVSLALRVMIDRAGIINRDVVDGYLMFCNFFIKLLNMGLNIVLTHFINYGGRNKVLSLFRENSYLGSPSFRVGEEVSFGLSFSIYMVNALILIPNALFLLSCFLLPLLNSFLVLAMDYDVAQASKLLQYGTLNLANCYSDDLSNTTCCLFLLFLIKDRKQGVLVFLSLCVSYFLNYLKFQFIVLRRSSRHFYSSWRLAYFSYVMWVFPTLILALCPRFWEWRGGEGSLLTILLSGVMHVILYAVVIYLVFGPSSRVDPNLSLSEVLDVKAPAFDIEPDYGVHNPVNRLRALTREYNVL